MAEQQSEQTVSIKTIARVCNITERRVNQLAKENIIPRHERGRYPFIRCVTSYIQYLQARLDGLGSTSPNIEDAKARKIAAEARLAEIELANAEFETIAIKDHAKLIGNIAEIIKSKLISLPTILAPALAMETSQSVCRSHLEEHVHAALVELTSIISDNRERLEERAESARAVSAAVPSPTKAQRGTVGRSRAKAQPRGQRGAGTVEK